MQRLIRQATRGRSIAALMALALVAAMMASQKLAARHLHVPIIGEQMLHNIGHVMVYGLLGALARLAAGRRVAMAWFIAATISSLEEWSQRFIPGRDCGLDDAILNIGAITLAMWMAGRWMNRTAKPFELRLVGGCDYDNDPA